MKILIDKLGVLSKSGEVFDFKNILSLYVLDIPGEVAFSKIFGAQDRGEAKELHAITDHLLLSGVIGELPCQNLWKTLARMSPVP